ncbi:hypothetical protein SDC9_192835 [bioreactor metagenome]|uniref:Uncharacterized protein n=1 Tax=bioreactor metagenome TaxID=1076179 RepID=A0A645I204_9ZZZZ
MKLFGVLVIFISHAGTSYELQLMQFQRGKRQTRKGAGLRHDFFRALTRQSQYNMTARKNASRSSSLDGINGFGERMSAVDPYQRLVIGTFNSIFNQ